MLHRWRLLPTGTWYSSLLSFSHSVVSDSFWPMDCSMPGFPVLHHFPELSQLMSIESVMPSNHFVLCHPLLLLPSVLPRIRFFSKELALLYSRQILYWLSCEGSSCASLSPKSLLKFMAIKSVMLPNHLILCHPLLLLPSVFSSIRVFSNKLVLCIRWSKYWSFSFSISPSNEYSGLISFRIGLISLQFKGLSRVFSNTTVRKHQFFSAQPSLLSSSHIHTWLPEKQ